MGCWGIPLYWCLKYCENIIRPRIFNTKNNQCLYLYRLSADLEYLINKNNYIITMREAELNGTERFQTDNVLTQDECDILVDLAQVQFYPCKPPSSARVPHVHLYCPPPHL